MKLTHKLKGTTVKIKHVNFNDLHILHKLNNIGIAEGNIIKIMDYENSKKILHLLIYGVEYVLREKDCHNIYVTKII